MKRLGVCCLLCFLLCSIIRPIPDVQASGYGKINANIFVTVKEPESGRSPSYGTLFEYPIHIYMEEYMEIPSNFNWAEVGWRNGIQWVDLSRDSPIQQMKTGDTFIKGHAYQVNIMLDIKDKYNYTFSGNLNVYVNGQLASWEPYMTSQKRIKISYTFPALNLFDPNVYGFRDYDGGKFLAYGGQVLTSANGVVPDGIVDTNRK